MNSGIYAIRHQSGKVYVGSSVNIPRRLAQHHADLWDGTHHCRRLQHDWLRWSGEGFQAEILEHCDSGELAAREQAYIDMHKRSVLYNTQLTVSRNGSGRSYAGGAFRNDPIAKALGCPAQAVILILLLFIILKGIRRVR